MEDREFTCQIVNALRVQISRPIGRPILARSVGERNLHKKAAFSA